MITREVVERALSRPRVSPRVLHAGPAIPAAVAVPITFDEAPIAHAVLRSSTLRDHAGEVGFPGGKCEPTDADRAATALRELAEEVSATGEVIGALTPVPVITGRYLIHPFVVALSGAKPTISSPEIAAILPIDLGAWVDGSLRIGGVEGTWQGLSFVTPHFDLGRAVLYGASAFVLYELLLAIAAELGKTLPPPQIVTEPPWGDRYR